MAVTRPGEKPALPSPSTIIGLLVIFSEALNRMRAAGRALIASDPGEPALRGLDCERFAHTSTDVDIWGGFAAASEPRSERLQDLRVHRDVVVLAC